MTSPHCERRNHQDERRTPGTRWWVRRLAPPLLLTATLGAAAGCSYGGTPPSAGGGPSATADAASAGPSTGTPLPSTPPSAVPTQRPAPVESNPPGDIPDTIAYVPYVNTVGRYRFVHPEGWASVVRGATVTFSDKLNGITATAQGAGTAPSVATARQGLPALTATQPAFELRSVKSVTLPAGTGVLMVFRRNSAADPVTGKIFRDEVERYQIYRAGRLVTLDLYGPVGADNVDPYTKISQSLRLS